MLISLQNIEDSCHILITIYFQTKQNKSLMKTFYILLFGLFFSINLKSQSPSNPFFNDISTIFCPFDPDDVIVHPDHWLIYQTLNDKWDGEIDSTRCINVIESVNWGIDVDLSQIDPQKAVFIRSILNDSNKILLEPNTLHNVSAFINFSEDIQINTAEDCPGELCSGLIIGIEIPDSSGNEKAMRIYKSSSNSSTYFSTQLCLSTEKFEENYLREYIFKISFESQNLDNAKLIKPRAYNEIVYDWGDYRIYEMDVPESFYNGSSYDVGIKNFTSSESNFLLMYNDTTYPSPSHISFVEASPLPNKPTQEVINVYIEEYETLVYQPYTEPRAGLVEGNDTLRHVLNLNNWGGTICMEPYIDVSFDGTTHYVHHSGHIEFHGTTSCMIFKNGGNLTLAENTTFHYGNGGEGMLAICDGSTINIEKGGTLVIDNQMVLKTTGEKEDQQVYMELNPGSTLKFTENAKLSHVGLHPEMRLNVYMNGGVLDDHLLSETERRLINKIYPKPDVQNNFKLSPNPAGEYCNFSLIVENGGVFSLKIIDMSGRVVQYSNKTIQKGYNEFEIDLTKFSSGVYFLKVESNEINTSQKLIKL